MPVGAAVLSWTYEARRVRECFRVLLRRHGRGILLASPLADRASGGFQQPLVMILGDCKRAALNKRNANYEK